MKRLLVLTLVFCLGWVVGPALAEEPAEPPAPPAATGTPANGIIGMLVASTAEQYDRVSELIRTQYPTLSDEIIEFVFAEQPDLLAKLMPALAPTLARDYPEVPGIIRSVIADHDQLRLRTSQIIQETYPQFEADLQQIPPGPNRRQQVAELISRKYPQLTGSLVDVLHREFPAVLNDAWKQIEAKYPNLVADMARLTVRTFPALTAKVITYLVLHYPQLVPQILALLAPAEADLTPPPPTTLPPPAE